MNRVHSLGALAIALLTAACVPGGSDVSTTSSNAIEGETTSTSTTSGTSATSTQPTPVSTTLPLSELRIVLTEIDAGFDRPVLLVADPAGGPDFVVEQPGRIVRVDGEDHVVALDIREDVRFAGEQGLLGLAFHPEFVANRLAYVNYIDLAGRTVIAQFAVRDGVFDVASRVVILTVDQPAGNHNGGMIAFGPLGLLWIGMGDGGGANDSFGTGQDPYSLLGSMLRIAVPGSDGNSYHIPELNPYKDGVNGAPEVYATGLRNPWRFSFDRTAFGEANLWIADVGQDRIEEVNMVSSTVAGANYGWPIKEGSECFQSPDCDDAGLVVPVVEYDDSQGCSITGGYVYRGSAIPELDGSYFYSDFCSGILRSYSPASGSLDWTAMTGPIESPTGFGIGGDGELYVVSHSGAIYRIERAG